ncbi:MAG: hypothetical protein ABF297_03655 [Thiogranum sp.]
MLLNATFPILHFQAIQKFAPHWLGAMAAPAIGLPVLFRRKHWI